MHADVYLLHMHMYMYVSYVTFLGKHVLHQGSRSQYLNDSDIADCSDEDPDYDIQKGRLFLIHLKLQLFCAIVKATKTM